MLLYSPEDYKLIIQKTPKMEYDITLVHEERPKTSLWACNCSPNKNNINSKKLITFNLDNSILNVITNMSFTNENSYYKLDNFIEVNTKNFVNLLKQFTGLNA